MLRNPSAMGISKLLVETYDDWADTYDECNPISDQFSVTGVEHRVISILLRDLTPMRLLDAAGGTGRWSRHFTALGWDVTLMDQSSKMLMSARRACNAPHQKFNTLQSDLCDLPFRDGSFDAVICSFALIHVFRTRTALLELARVLSINGILIVSDIHPNLQHEWGEGHTIQLKGGVFPFPAYNFTLAKYFDPLLEQSLSILKTYELPCLIQMRNRIGVFIIVAAKNKGTIYSKENRHGKYGQRTRGSRED